MWAQTPQEVGRIIEAARRHRRLTQSALAKAIGSTQAWISEVERGKENAQIGRILRVLSYLDVRLTTGAAPWMGSRVIAPKSGNLSLSNVIDAHSEAPSKNRVRVR